MAKAAGAFGVADENVALRAQVEKLTRELELARQDLIDKNALTIRLASMEQRAEQAEAKLMDALGGLASIESEMRGKSYMRETARAALAAARESAPAEPPCRCVGDGHKPDCEFWMSLETGR
jgi:hypothetical protein